MKLLCINAKDLKFVNENGQTVTCEGRGLVEGEEYTTRGTPFYSGQSGQPSYYIDGLGPRLCCRFTTLLDDSSDIEEAIEKLKEEFDIN